MYIRFRPVSTPNLSRALGARTHVASGRLAHTRASLSFTLQDQAAGSSRLSCARRRCIDGSALLRVERYGETHRGDAVDEIVVEQILVDGEDADPAPTSFRRVYRLRVEAFSNVRECR